MSWKKTTPDTSKKPIASFLKTKSSTIATPIHREKATREEKKTMSPEQRAQYKVERTATKEAARAAMTEEARKTYDEERAARKIAKAEAAKKPVVAGKQSTQEETSETKPASTRLSTVTTPAKLSTEEIKKLSPAELARYKKQQTAQQEELKTILAEERKTLHSLQTPKERIKYLTQKYGKWVAGAAAFTLLPASAGGLGLGEYSVVKMMMLKKLHNNPQFRFLKVELNHHWEWKAQALHQNLKKQLLLKVVQL